MKTLRDETQSVRSLIELEGDGCTADTNASRGAPLKKKASRRFVNKFCECGQPAVTRSANSMACQRCADLTDRMGRQELSEVCGVRESAMPELGWQDISDACTAFFRRRGITVFGGLGMSVK